MSEDTDRSFLSNAHLLVAGIRVYTHREGRPPAVEDIAEFLKTTPELIYHTANRLEKEGVVKGIRTSFETKLYIADTSKLKDLDEDTIPDLDEEIKKTRARKQEEQEKLGALFSASEIEKRRKQKMADLEKKMKDGMGKPKSPFND